MALVNDSKTMSPNVGVRGNPQDLPTLKPSVALNTEAQTPDFVGAMNNLATTPTAVSQFATRAMVSASNAMMDKWGYEQGQDPHGELLPAITDADKRFNEAYTNQAKATITLNGQKMFMDAEEEINQQYKLTPELINTYKQQMALGAQELLELAPSGLKPELQNNFASTLLKTSHELNNKMIGQQKEQYLDHMSALNDLHTTQIYDFAKIGGELSTAQAMDMTQKQIALNKQMVANGQMKESTAQTKNDALEVAFMAGGNIAEYNKKRLEGKGEKFLSDMADSKPAGVSTEKWQQVEKAVLQEVSNRELMRKRDQQITQQQFDYKSANNMVTQNDIDDIKQKLDPLPLLQTLIKFSAAKGKANATEVKSNELMSRWGEAKAFGDYSADIKNQTYSRMVKATIQKAVNEGKPAPDEFQSSIDVARSAGGSIPRFQDELNQMILSGDGAQMQAALTAEHLVGSGKAGLSKKADNMKWSYLGNIAQGMSQLEAGARALEESGNLNEKELDAVVQEWKSYERETFPTPLDKKKFAQQLSGFGDDWFFQAGPFSTKTIYEDVMIDKMINAYRSNWIALHKNEQAAIQKTKYNFENSMGHTFANGEKQWTFAPIEKIAGLPEGGATTNIIQADIRQQVEPQLVATKAAYDAGNLDYYYRLKEPEYRLVTPGLNVASRDKAIQLEKVNRSARKKLVLKDGKEVFEDGDTVVYDLEITPSPTMGSNINVSQSQQIEYDVSIRSQGRIGVHKGINFPWFPNIYHTPEGAMESIVPVGNQPGISYRPNIQKLKTDYLNREGINPEQQSLQEARDKAYAIVRAQHRREEEAKVRNPYPTM